ncbi:MAG: class I SAM-dependent methyltransferase [Sporichthyaceae bacterium]
MVSRYDAAVDPENANNAHSLALAMVGWNRRVLELGAASGHMTKAMVAQNCRVTAVEYEAESAMHLKEVAEAVIVGDLNDVETVPSLPGPYDVILAGDVLEHLLDPKRVLLQLVDKLEPGGRIVVSLPHVAHVDLRLALLQGRFDYGPWGLLDETHIRFFTLKTLRELVQSAGLSIVEMKRVRVPAFESELRVDRKSVSTALLNEILADPEAETYQFVFTAVRNDGDGHLVELANKYDSLQADYQDLFVTRQAERARIRALQKQVRQLETKLGKVTQKRDASLRQLDALRRSRVLRYSAPARAVLRRSRRVLRAKK